MRALTVLFAASVALSAAAPAVVSQAAQPEPSAADVAKRVQAHYDTVQDFRADFTEVDESGVLHTQSRAEGQVRVKKPGRMYWDYKKPDPHVWIADGQFIVTYTPATRDCAKDPIPQGDDIPVAVLFLAGRGDLIRDFTPSLPLAAQQPARQWRLTLKPKKPQESFDHLDLFVDHDTYKLVAFRTTNRDGDTTTFSFTNMRENTRLSDLEFTFVPPTGVHCN